MINSNLRQAFIFNWRFNDIQNASQLNPAINFSYFAYFRGADLPGYFSYDDIGNGDRLDFMESPKKFNRIDANFTSLLLMKIHSDLQFYFAPT
jgi:hypothetical protein